jgi:DNA-binding NarL/FixJ family response regulator
MGLQIWAHFAPVDDLYFGTARARHARNVLSTRETEVAEHYAAGDSFRTIAQALGLAPTTVRSHLRNVFGKLHVRSKLQLAAVLR